MMREKGRAVAAAVWLVSIPSVLAPAPTTPAPTAPVPAPIVPAPTVSPPPVDTDRVGIAAAYDALNADYAKGDLKSYFTWFTPDYQVTGTDGKTADLIKVEKQTRQDQGELTSFHSHWTLGPLTPALVSGSTDSELVVVTTHSSGTGQKKVLFFTAKGSFVDDTQTRDLWVNTPQGWRLMRRLVLTDHLQSHPG